MTQEELIAFCGINCLECPAYIAKRTDDKELREKTIIEIKFSSFLIPEELELRTMESALLIFEMNYLQGLFGE